MIPFIDVSRHQGTINFTTMRSRGVEGVYLRAGNGIVNDPTFPVFLHAARAADLKVGAYWFCNPKVSGGADQGRRLAAWHAWGACELPVMFDVEDYSHQVGPSSAEIYGSRYAAWLHAGIDAAAQATNEQPILYTNKAYWDGPIHGVKGAAPHVGDPSFGHLDLICARYPFYDPAACAAHVPPLDAESWDEWIMAETPKRPQVPTGWSTWAAWQFSAGFNGRGHAYGATSADLDLNIARDDAWARWLNLPPQPPTPLPIPEDDMHTLPTPQRIFDSRVEHIDGRTIVPGSARISAGTVLEVPIMAEVVGVNITVVNPARPGYLTAWGKGAKPETSNVNYATGTESNFAQVLLDGGLLRIWSSAPCDIVVDLQAAG